MFKRFSCAPVAITFLNFFQYDRNVYRIPPNVLSGCGCGCGSSKMADVELDAGGLKQTFKDLFAGAAGGVAQVLIGQ